jgi:hypothetical protein
VRFGYSWPLGHGRRMWVSGPIWLLILWVPFWLAGMVLVLAVWVLVFLAEVIARLVVAAVRAVTRPGPPGHRRPRLPSRVSS